MKMERHISYKPGVYPFGLPIEWNPDEKADGKLYVLGRMCPHMHGELKWNGDTKTWDCPCHGSRFDYMGHVIDNPTMEDLKYDSITEYE